MVRPVRLSVVLTFMMAPPPAGPAGSSSGTAAEKAPMVTPCRRLQVMLRMPTAAGNFGLRIVPSGMMQRAGRVMPPFSRIVGIDAVEAVGVAHHQQDVAFGAAGRHVERRLQLRVGPGEVHDRLVAADLQGQGKPRRARRPARPRRGSRRRNSRRRGCGRAGRAACRSPRSSRSLTPWRNTSTPNLRTMSCTLRSPVFMRRDLRLQVALVLLGHADVGQHHIEQRLVQLARLVELVGRDPDAFLMDLGQLPRQRGRHRPTDVGVVDVADREGDELVLPEDRLPHVQVGRVGATKPL